MNEKNDFKKVIGILKKLHHMEAPVSLRDRITDNISDLSDNNPLFVRPFVSLNKSVFRFAMIGILFLASSATLVYAIGKSQPGSSLYKFKESAEDTITSLPLGNIGVYLELKFAETKIDDMRTVVRASDSAALDTLTSDYEKHVQNAVGKTVESQKKENEFTGRVSTDLKKQRDELSTLDSDASVHTNESINRAMESAKQGIREIEKSNSGQSESDNVRDETNESDNENGQNTKSDSNAESHTGNN